MLLLKQLLQRSQACLSRKQLPAVTFEQAECVESVGGVEIITQTFYEITDNTELTEDKMRAKYTYADIYSVKLCPNQICRDVYCRERRALFSLQKPVQSTSKEAVEDYFSLG